MRASLLSIVVALLPAGCAGGTIGYTATVSSDVYGPDLVYAAPGVQVIADFDEPIFFADNFYWRFYGGTWYRSTYHTGGWVYAPPPPAIRGIARPHEFVHYRPTGWVARRTPGRPAPIVRDHRDDRPRFEPRPQPRSEPRPPPRQPPSRKHDRDRDHR